MASPLPRSARGVQRLTIVPRCTNVSVTTLHKLWPRSLPLWGFFFIIRAPRNRFALEGHPELGTFADQNSLADLCVRMAQGAHIASYRIYYV